MSKKNKLKKEKFDYTKTNDNIDKLGLWIESLNAPWIIKIIFYILSYIIIVPIAILHGAFSAFWVPIRFLLLIFGPVIIVWWLVSMIQHVIGR